MIARSAWRAWLITGFVAACSTMAPTISPAQLPDTPSATPTAATAAPTSMTAPSPTPDYNRLPPTTTTGWWGDPDNPTQCMVPGHYRIGTRVAPLGDCWGVPVEGPKSITLDVGEDFDLHMTIPADGALPIYPLPEAEDPLVALGWLIFDDATMTYRALSPGTTRLVSARPCDRRPESASVTPPPGDPCPVLVVHVRDIETECIDLTEDVCRAAGVAAVSNLFADPGQKLVGWVAKPDSFIGGPDCGQGVASVTVTLRDPHAEYTVQIGRLDPLPSGPPRYVVCTY